MNMSSALEDSDYPSLFTGRVQKTQDQTLTASVFDCTITNVVHQKAYAFAKTSRGEGVFIPARVHEALGKPQKGDRVKLKVKKSDRGLQALMPPTRSEREWGDWQIGPTQVPLPDTVPGSNHHAISFACFKCGATIVNGHNIHRFKQATVWTRDASILGHTLETGKEFYNEWKKVSAHAVCCKKCKRSVGAIYTERYHKMEEGTPIPCIKLYLTQEQVDNHHGNDQVYNTLVLCSESREMAELHVSRLVRVQGDEGGLRCRTTKWTHELHQKLQQAETDKQALSEAETRAKTTAQKEQLRREQAELKANLMAAKYAAIASQHTQWSYEMGNGAYLPYDESINALIEAAYNPADPTKSHPVTWKARGFDYQIFWGYPAQINMKTQTCRLIQRKETMNTAQVTARKLWSTQGQEVEKGVFVHSICASDLKESNNTRELEEFNFAYAQLQRLCPPSKKIMPIVRQVDVYESLVVSRNYAKKKSALAQSRELWVFHGTPKIENVSAIMAGGFKVGGQGVRVANGSAYGLGVYTATGPNTPMQYAGNSGNRVILAKALEGVKGEQGVGDCWAPRGDWLVFKTGEQLLPSYVVHWG
jgi:hypothetical protein